MSVWASAVFRGPWLVPGGIEAPPLGASSWSGGAGFPHSPTSTPATGLLHTSVSQRAPSPLHQPDPPPVTVSAMGSHWGPGKAAGIALCAGGQITVPLGLPLGNGMLLPTGTGEWEWIHNLDQVKERLGEAGVWSQAPRRLPSPPDALNSGGLGPPKLSQMFGGSAVCLHS